MSWKILLVDDDLEDWEILHDAFKKLDTSSVIHHTLNGELAISLLNSEYEKKNMPGLIVLDLNMPILNGTETLKRLKADERFKHIPVIIYSTSINPIEREKCMFIGADNYITKPISFKESIETVKKFLMYCKD